MNSDITVIWQRGDDKMPEKAMHVVETAKTELLLKSLQLPHEVVNDIKYNANKQSQSVCNYISSIVLEHFKSA